MSLSPLLPRASRPAAASPAARAGRRPAFLWLVAVLALLIGVAGCSLPSDERTEAAGNQTAGSTDGEQQPGDEEATPAPPAQVRFSVRHGAEVDFRGRPQVTASGGEITDVTFASLAGVEVTGHLDDAGAWAPDWLTPSTEYRVRATAVNGDGARTTETFRFRTSAPPATDFPAMTPLAGSTVGVGHPAVIYFDTDVEFKAAVQKRLTVTSSEPVEGSWGWIDDRTVAYRPKNYWPEHTKVTVTIDLDRVRTGPGVWVMEDREISFQVGRHQVLRIDDASHLLTVHRAGEVVRTVPVSMGKPGFVTRSGIKVIMSRERTRRMDSATVGLTGDEAYDVVVPFALRITNSGEFIHGAPWSVGAQGSRNVSHGCVNVSLAHGEWLYQNTLVGDPVETVGTGRPAEVWNGLGGIWNFSWDQWLDRSALG